MDYWFLQTIVNGAITGSLYFLAAIGLTMQYDLMKFPNLAHAEFFAIGAYATYLISDVVGWGFPLGIALGIVMSGAISLISYFGVFRVLQRRGATMLHLTVASIGLAFFIRYMLWQIGGRRSYYYSYETSFVPIHLGPVRVTTLWIAIVVAAALVMISLHLFLTRSRLGKALRGLSGNPTLARVSGVDADKILALVWLVAGALAGLGGVLRAADTRIIPELGAEVLIPMFAVIILGGVGSIAGALIASYILGLAESFGVVLLVALGLSVEYKVLISFMVLVATILFAPTGLGPLVFKEAGRRD